MASRLTTILMVKFFNLKRPQAKTKVEGVLVHDFLFADDCALNATSEAETQEGMDQFSAACANFDLTMNTKKMPRFHHPAPHHLYIEPSVKVNRAVLNAVDEFSCLGSVPGCTH